MNLSNLSVSDILKGFEENLFSSLDLVKHYIEKIESLNEEYNVYLYVRNKSELFAEAEKADEERKKGITKKLLGVPYALKDSFMAKGTPTTAGDKVLEGTISEYNSTIVEKLLNEGAILLGKLNMDSWGFGSSTENSAYGVTKNPFDKTRVAGGSSGGSGAAVALDMCAFAIGEDTGGSIRNPASFCGVYGLKPTYGRISRFGCIAYASSLDSIGPVTRSATDLMLVMQILEGVDGKDMTLASKPSAEMDVIKKRFAYSMDYIPDQIDTDTKKLYLDTIEKLKALGHEAIEVKLRTLDYCIPAYYITAMSEASTNLSRYQGTRYGSMNNKLANIFENGQLVESIATWEELFTEARTQGFTTEAKRRVLLGAYVLSEGFYDAYYKKAQKVRNLISEEIDKILNDVDFILSPITLSHAPKIGEKISDPVQMYMEDIYTVTANLAGIPSVAIPAGKSSQNLPIGMQLMGKRFNDEKLIEIASQI